ncbi:MAG: glycoside hydrolase family 3 N-terminal domain-containing protein [Longimicrobiales bacterium]
MSEAGRLSSRLTAVVFGMMSVTGTSFAQEPRGEADYWNPELPIAQRVEDLLERMTLEEKVAQMLSMWQGRQAITNDQGEFDPTDAPEWFRLGIGRIERTSEQRGAREQADYTNAIQQWVKENTPLGIPVLFHEEALHGLMAPEATSFPQSIALASTWNPELVERVFTVTAAEARARGVHQVLAPVVDVGLDPRWGRIEETFGEDPYLTARMGVAAVRGFQGPYSRVDAGSSVAGSAGVSPSAPAHVFATLKHLTGHGEPESGTNIGPASIGERRLREVFFYPFEVAIREAGARSVMASYNEIDGVPSHANTWMLKDVLRGEWGFDGVVVSDWFAIRQLIDRHRVASDAAGAARLAVAATVDIELSDVDTYAALVDEVRAGRVDESAIDAAVRRLLRAKFTLGLFEDPFVDPERADSTSGAEAHRALALEAARQAITLLKNDGGVLPLRAEDHARVAVIGPHAAEVLLGGYSGVPRHRVSILEGVRDRLGGEAIVEYAEGVRITEDSTFTSDPQPHMGGARSGQRWSGDVVLLADSTSNGARITEAVELARRSQLAILVVGGNEATSREAYAEEHLGDRTELGLPGQQEQLVHAVLATGTPTVLVLINGRPLSIPEVVEAAPAILEGWYLGQETGTAVAEALFGDLNPGGKLPVTVARSVGQLPVFYNHKPSARRGYLFDTTDPLFPFGYGLSYTTFEYSTPRVTPARIEPSGTATVSVDVTNTGDRAGDEVVQLYVGARVSRATRAVKQLRGFERVRLEPGETRTVTFELARDALEYVGPEMVRVVEPGTYNIMVGGDSRDVQMVALEVHP